MTLSRHRFKLFRIILLDLLIVNAILFYFLKCSRCKELRLDHSPLLFELFFLEVLVDHVIIFDIDWRAHARLGDYSLLLVESLMREFLDPFTLMDNILERNPDALELLCDLLPAVGLQMLVCPPEKDVIHTCIFFLVPQLTYILIQLFFLCIAPK